MGTSGETARARSPNDVSAVVCAQPIADTSFGRRCSGGSVECDASPLGSTNGEVPELERIEHLIAMAKVLFVFFKCQMNKVTDEVNDAPDLRYLDLSVDKFPLSLDDDMVLADGKRFAVCFGPIKKADRAYKKAKEYGKIIKE